MRKTTTVRTAGTAASIDSAPQQDTRSGERSLTRIESHLQRAYDLAQYLETIRALSVHVDNSDERFVGDLGWLTHNLANELLRDLTGEIEKAQQITRGCAMTPTVAGRIYYAQNRASFLRKTFDAIIEDHGTLTLEGQDLQGLCDALEDIERALQPLTEIEGGLPSDVYSTVVDDVEPEPA